MKKMRRLIPAIAMLLVSAVMLSTASFAWFTMNEAVTASGMQIQAKADGSLLISDAPFTADNLGKADLVISDAVQNLYPMAYHDGAAALGTLDLAADKAAGWYKPANNENSNISTGANNGDYAQIEAAKGYAFKQEYYLATAGAPQPGATIKVELKAPVHPEKGETHKAYAAAIYVIDPSTQSAAWEDDGNIDFKTTAPTKIVYVGEGNDDTDRNTTTVTGDIPSVASASTAGTKVGLKVIVYYYVDGQLSTEEEINVLLGYKHVASSGAYDATKAYYKFTVATLSDGADLTGYYQENTADNSYSPVIGKYSATTGGTYYTRTLVEPTDEDKLSQNLTKYFVVDGTTTDDVFTPTPVYAKSTYTYVRSADIANTPASLTLTFSADVAD